MFRGAWPSISSISPISPVSPAAMGRPAAAWDPAADGLCAGAVGRSASNWRFCASSRGGSTSPWAFRRGRRGSDGRSQPSSAARARGLVVVAGSLALTPLPVETLRAPSCGGSGARPPQPPAPDAPVARALSQSLPEGERVRDALPHGHLCVSSLRGERAPTRGRPYGEGIDSHIRGNDGVSAGFAGVSSGSGARPPQATRPRRACGACPLSVSPRGREV